MSTEQTVKQTDWEDNQEDEEVHEDENEDEDENDHEVMFYAKTFDTAYEQAVKYLNNLSMVVPERVYYLDKRDTEIDLVSVSRLWFMSVERTEATATIREVRQSK